MIRTNGPAKLKKEKKKSRFQKVNLTVCIKSDRVAQLNVIIKHVILKCSLYESSVVISICSSFQHCSVGKCPTGVTKLCLQKVNSAHNHYNPFLF